MFFDGFRDTHKNDAFFTKRLFKSGRNGYRINDYVHSDVIHFFLSEKSEKFWFAYPSMLAVMDWYMAAALNSAGAERGVSTVRRIHTDQRSRMGQDLIEALVFVCGNVSFDSFDEIAKGSGEFPGWLGLAADYYTQRRARKNS